MSDRVEKWAAIFQESVASRTPAPRLTQLWPDATLDDAYAIQQFQVRSREAAGEQVTAIKLGLVQQVEQDQWQIPHPTFGTLTNRMTLPPGDPFVYSRGHHPLVEPEIVVVLGQTMVNPPATLDDLRSSISSVHAGIEILDSRFHSGSFHPVDAVADNQSALSGVWSAEGKRPDDCDTSNESVVVTVDGQLVETGHSSRIMGDPLRVVLDAIRERCRRGLACPAGLAIFSGNLCARAIEVTPGQRVEMSFSTLGSMSLDVIDGPAPD